MSRKKSLALGLMLAVTWLASSGYVVQVLNDASFTQLRWMDFPIEIRIWQGFESSPVIDEGSDPLTAITEAMERWARSTSLSIVLGPDTATESAGIDGLNIITIADTTTNRNIVGQSLGVSSAAFNSLTGEVVEADVIISPAPPTNWSTLEGDNINLFDVVMHEFGHNWDLDHPVSRGSTMYFSGGSFDRDLTPLHWDDVAGANSNYPMVGIDQITGSISGTVTMGGNAAMGVFVVAVDDQGRMVTNDITLPDGSYRIRFLPPGDYILYAEPLDGGGINAATNLTVNNGPFSNKGAFVTDFVPTFYQGSRAPNVTVTQGNPTTGIDFALTSASNTIEFELMNTSPTFSGSASNRPVTAVQGETTNLVLAGTTLDTVNDDGIFALGGVVSIGSVAATGAGGGGTTFKFYPLSIPLDAARGDYPLFMESATEVNVFTNAMLVLSPLRLLQAFAQFANFEGAITSGVFLINTNLNSAATGKVSARDAGGGRNAISLGSLSTDSNNDLDFTLDPGSSLSVTTSGADFLGSLRVHADRIIGGTALFESAFGTTGVGPSRPLHTFVAPVEFGTGINTGLAFTNLDEQAANVFVQVQDRNGSAVGSTVVDLPASGHSARNLDEILPGVLGTSFEGSAVITSNRPIGATVISTRPGIFTTFPAIQNRIFTRSFFAQFAHVEGALASELVLVNPSPTQTASVTVQVRDSDGNTPAVTLSGEVLATGQKTLSIEALGSVKLVTGSDIVGSAEVFTSNQPVGGVVLFSGPSVGTAGVGESFPETQFVLPIERDEGAGTDTGIAVVNTTNQNVQLTLTVRAQDGSTVTQTQVALGPDEQLARFPNQDPFNLGLSAAFSGSLWITADGEVAATVIRQSPGILTTFPVLSLDQFITPQD